MKNLKQWYKKDIKNENKENDILFNFTYCKRFN